MKHNKDLFLLTLLLCLTLIIIPVNGALPSNRIVVPLPGIYLEPYHGPDHNYTWTGSGRIYGDISGKITWYEEGNLITGGEFYTFKALVNGTIETDDGMLYTFKLGNKSGEPYTYQCLGGPTKYRCSFFRITGELYINDEYKKYCDEYGLTIPPATIIPY